MTRVETIEYLFENLQTANRFVLLYGNQVHMLEQLFCEWIIEQ